MTIQSDECRRWSEAEIFYTPAVIDYAFLEKYFISVDMHRSEYAVMWRVYDGNGRLQDEITDTIPIPDALHALQTSVAFLEKTLKYLIAIHGRSTERKLRKMGHNLRDLLDLVDQAAPDFTAGMTPALRACLDEMAKVDYTVLRYLNAQAPEFEVRFADLTELLQYNFAFLKETRWAATHSDPVNRKSIAGARITVSIEPYREPLQSLFQVTFERVVQHPDLSEEQRNLLRASYRYDRDAGRYLRRDGIDDETCAALFQAFETAKFVPPDFGRLKIRLGH